MTLNIWQMTWPGDVDSLGPRLLLDICHSIIPPLPRVHAFPGSVDNWRGILPRAMCCDHFLCQILMRSLVLLIPSRTLRLGVPLVGCTSGFPHRSHTYDVRGESLLQRVEDLEEDCHLLVHSQQTELKILHPLAEFKDQAVQDSQAVSELIVKERVQRLIPVRRRFSPSCPRRVLMRWRRRLEPWRIRRKARGGRQQLRDDSEAIKIRDNDIRWRRRNWLGVNRRRGVGGRRSRG
jgi:hypothetical protein